MTIDQLKLLVKSELDQMDSYLITLFEKEAELPRALGQHILNAGGKRIRPLLALLSCHACGSLGPLPVSIATLIECFHAATLLHDDVIDGSTLRRGKKTAHSIWGGKASVLVGDLLLALVVDLLLKLNHPNIQNMLATTVRDITRGELKQLSSQYDAHLSYEDYLDIIRSKTALLFAASAVVGPMLAGHTSLEKHFYNYGLHLGNAFQLIDDSLDYCADPQTMGKNNGDDLADGKVTLPVLHVLKHGNELQKQLIIDGLKSGSQSRFLEILDAMESTGAIEYTRAAANREKDLAIACLDPLPESDYKTALIELAMFTLERNY